MYDVAVVGGGVAGSALAISLAESGRKVVLFERRRLPAHKICGEFLSYEAVPMLQRLGVMDKITQLGAMPIGEIAITSPGGRSWRCRLPGTSLGLSRYHLDQTLFAQAESVGANCMAGVAVIKVTGDLEKGFSFLTRSGSVQAQVAVAAFGKRSTLATSCNASKLEGRFVGFKEHYVGSVPNGVVEVHTFDRGYCGIAAVENGNVNVCFLTELSILRSFGGSRHAVLADARQQNSLLDSRLSALSPVPGTLCAIGGVSLGSRGHFDGDILKVGDAVQMIAPFCGDGIGMALRSAEIAAVNVNLLLSSKISRKTFIHKYTKEWKDEFSARLFVGQLVQNAALAGPWATLALSALDRCPAAGEWLVHITRGRRSEHLTV